MIVKRENLIKFIRNILIESFQSHTHEPEVGTSVINLNPNCTHYKSKGMVLKVSDLDNDMGKVITYRVSNNGDTYKKGQILTKTLDQLQPQERQFEN